MRVVILDNKQAVGVYAANVVEAQITAKPGSVLGLATGSTPIPLYQELVRRHTQKGLDFSRVKTFNLDEYLLLGRDDKLDARRDQSYGRFMDENLFDRINICRDNTHVPDGLHPYPEEHCRTYEGQILNAGGIDLQALGIGSDGHIAFNEPGSPLSSRTRVVDLQFSTLVDNYKAFVKNGGYIFSDMPLFALTMGVGTIMEAKKIILLATGSGKGAALRELVEGPVTDQVTATALKYHNNVIVVADRAAAEGKPVSAERRERDGLANTGRYEYAMKVRELYAQMEEAREKGASISDLKKMQKQFLEKLLAENFGRIQDLLKAKQQEG